MCGICGFNWNDEQLCRSITELLKHRGPDDEGFYFDQEVSLGHRRLSIIDLEGGHQPICNENKSIWIIYNGEIYNHIEVRRELEGKHRFYTNSDAEVIIHAYEEYGFDCVKKFNGMWAFCIYDKSNSILFLSRDRFGIKPLYYYFDNNRFIFASEIKGFIDYLKPEQNDEVIFDFLAFGKLEHHADTFFSGIKRLMPAHNLIFHLGSKKIEEDRYWDIHVMNEKIGSSSVNDEEYAKLFYDLIEDSVRIQLMSEVPVGTCLSGGLDSSTIVCLINKIIFSETDTKIRESIGERQKTFSAVYDDKKIDERKFIEEVTAATNVETNYVFPSGDELFKEIEKLVYYQDEPFTSTSIYAQWNVMRLASQKVKVLVDGQGSDELLAGYIAFFKIYLKQLLKERKYSIFFREILFSYDALIHNHRIISNALARNNIIYETILNQKFLDKFINRKQNSVSSDNIVSRSYEYIINGELQSLLKYEDRNSMAFSVEARVPFLDHRIAEFIFTAPVDQRIKNGNTKFILRNAMKGILPERIRKRKGKIGFATSEDKWLKDHKDEILKIFGSESFMNRKYFNHKAILKIFLEYCDGKKHDTMIFWKIIVLEIWLRIFIDRDENMHRTH